MLVTIFFSDSGEDDETEVLKDMKALGGITCAICDKASSKIRENADYLVEVGSVLG